MRLALGLLALGSLTGCRWTPEIGKDLPAKYSKAEPIFDARVKALFPVGTSEQQVLRTLEEQGFVRSPGFDGIESVTFTRNEFVTKTIWSVRWRAENNRIEEIWGVHGAIAP